MSDLNKRRALAVLTRNDLLLLGKAFKLTMSPRMSLAELHAALANQGHGTIGDMVAELPEASIARIAGALEIAVGKDKAVVVRAIVEAVGEGPAPVPAPEVPVAKVEQSTPAEAEVAPREPTVAAEPEVREAAPAVLSSGEPRSAVRGPPIGASRAPVACTPPGRPATATGSGTSSPRRK